MKCSEIQRNILTTCVEQNKTYFLYLQVNQRDKKVNIQFCLTNKTKPEVDVERTFLK